LLPLVLLFTFSALIFFRAAPTQSFFRHFSRGGF